MTRLIRRRLPVIAVLAVLLAGGTVAAMAAGGDSSSARNHGAAHHSATSGSHRRSLLLQSAAGYLGISPEAIEEGLRSGKSLGQLAREAGKTEAGLVQALATTARAGLERRLARAVKRPGGLDGRHRHSHRLRIAVAGYLGVTPAALSAQLRSGRSLAQIADATPGRSRAGLIDALVAARLAERTSAGHLLRPTAKGSAAARSARLRRRIGRLVDRPNAVKQKRPAGG